jgi:hypothetical protein
MKLGAPSFRHFPGEGVERMGLFFGLKGLLFGDKISQNCPASATSNSLIGANSAFLSMILWAGSLAPILLNGNRTAVFAPGGEKRPHRRTVLDTVARHICPRN